MIRGTRMAILAAVAAMLWALPAWAAGELLLYDGNLATAAAGLELSRFGSGAAESTTAVTYVGPEVIKLSTHGFYAGGVLRFTKSLDLGAYAGQPNAYLEFLVQPYFSKQVTQTTTTPGAPAGATMPTAPPVQQPVIRLGSSRDDDDDQGAVAPMQPAGPQTTTTTAMERGLLLEHFRLVMKTDQGYAVLPWWPVVPATKDERGWTRVDFPLAGFRGELGGRVDSLAIFGDRPDMFYIGRIQVRTDNTPLQATVQAYPSEGNVSDPFVFIATVQPGLADPEVRWDFNMAFVMAPDDPNYAKEFDAKFKVQTTGVRVTNIFTQPGDYVVGYMVVDKGGAKPPLRRTLTVTVKGREAENKPEAQPAY